MALREEGFQLNGLQLELFVAVVAGNKTHFSPNWAKHRVESIVFQWLVPSPRAFLAPLWQPKSRNLMAWFRRSMFQWFHMAGTSLPLLGVDSR